MCVRRLTRRLAPLAVVGLAVAACGPGSDTDPPGLAADESDVTVQASASTTIAAGATPTSDESARPTTGRADDGRTGTTATTNASTTSSTATPSTTATPSPSTAVPATTTIVPSSSAATPPSTTTPSSAPADPGVDPGVDGGTVTAPAMPATVAAFQRLAATNAAASLSVLIDGVPAVAAASGATLGGEAATSDSPMVVASVSKLVTALAIARFDESGYRDLDTPVPWAALGLPHHPAWSDVTARELLHHTSGMPVVRTSWFDGPGTCRAHLTTLLAAPPREHRGEWRYSNGNYCALGLLVAGLSRRPLGDALDSIVFEPAGVEGAHLTTGGQRPGDIGYAPGVGRLSRLGAAGTLIISTDDLARVLDGMSQQDRQRFEWPGVFVDQYGWGHTGTVDGAKACAWVMDDDRGGNGRVVVAATVAGNSPATGGGVCDAVVPAVASDLGGFAGTPERTPPGPAPVTPGG